MVSLVILSNSDTHWWSNMSDSNRWTWSWHYREGCIWCRPSGWHAFLLYVTSLGMGCWLAQHERVTLV